MAAPLADARGSERPGNNGGTQGRCSGLVPLLPFVEQNNIRPLYTFNLDWSDPQNTSVLTIPFALFRCPSSPSSDGMVLCKGRRSTGS